MKFSLPTAARPLAVLTGDACTVLEFVIHAERIFPRHPVTSVFLPDYAFCEASREGRWVVRTDHVPFLRHSPETTETYLPVEFRPFLTGGHVLIKSYGDRMYDTKSDAMAAISRAAVGVGRKRAGLPQLTTTSAPGVPA